jgi:hypothetical protein
MNSVLDAKELTKMPSERSNPTGQAWRRLLGVLALGLVMLFGTLPAPAYAAPYYHGGGGWHGGGWGWHGGCCWGGWGPGVYYGGPYYYDPSYDPNYYGYYTPPPVAAAPPPAANATVSNCQNGSWRQANGTMVTGTACLQSDGTWRMQ